MLQMKVKPNMSFFKINLIFAIMVLMPFVSQAESVQEKLMQGELALENDPVEVEKISYKIYGKTDKPWLVLIHGLGGSQNTWKPVIEELSKSFQVLTYDQRGHGDSTVEKENYSSATMARDLLALMDKLEIKQAHILGHSMGGRTAIRFGSQYPDRVLTLTIEDMHPLGRTKLLPDMIEVSRQMKPLYQSSFKSAEDFSESYRSFLNLEGINPTVFKGKTDKQTGRFFLNSKPHVNVLYQNQALQEDLTSALVDIKVPITFFAAGNLKQAVLFGKGLDHVKKNKPNARIIIFNEAGHSIHREASDLFTTELIESTSRAGRMCRTLFN